MTDPTRPAGSTSEAALDAALSAVSANRDQPYRLDDGECEITVPMPPDLDDGPNELVVTVRLTGDIVSFLSPLAALTTPDITADAATALLRRQFSALQTDGVGFAVADREDVLVAQYHWIPIELTPDAFTTIFGRFVAAALSLRDEIISMSSLGAPFQVL